MMIKMQKRAIIVIRNKLNDCSHLLHVYYRKRATILTMNGVDNLDYSCLYKTFSQHIWQTCCASMQLNLIYLSRVFFVFSLEETSIRTAWILLVQVVQTKIRSKARYLCCCKKLLVEFSIVRMIRCRWKKKLWPIMNHP
jgi:hypothetical protein